MLAKIRQTKPTKINNPEIVNSDYSNILSPTSREGNNKDSPPGRHGCGETNRQSNSRR